MPFSILPYSRFPVQSAISNNAGQFLKLLTYFLGFGILLALPVNSVPAYAEWVAVISSESSGGYTVYVDPDTIRHEEDGVEMWELYDHKTRGTKEGYSFCLSSSETNIAAEKNVFGPLRSCITLAVWEAAWWFLINQRQASGNEFHLGVLVKLCGKLHAARSDQSREPLFFPDHRDELWSDPPRECRPNET